MQFTDLKLSELHFEMRYEFAPLLWDRAGSIAHNMLRQFPTLKNAEASPSRVAFNLERRASFAIEIEKCVLSHLDPTKNWNETLFLAGELNALTSETLRIPTYKRVGVRLIYSRYFPTEEDSWKYVTQWGRFFQPSEALFNIKSASTASPDFKIELRDDSNAVIVRVYSFSHRLDITPPLNFVGSENITKEEHRASLDFDFYTRQSVNTEDFNASRWLEEKLHLSRRDGKRFMELS